MYRRSVASGEEEDAAPVRRSALDTAEASGEDEAEITIATPSTPELPTISTVEISTPSTTELPTISTTQLTTRSLPTLASISTASTRPLTTASLPTLAPITRAQRHAEGSGAAEEQL